MRPAAYVYQVDLSEALSVTWGQQVFTVVSQRPYTRKDGKETVIATWQAACVDCASLFTQTTGAKGELSDRRCKPCATKRRAEIGKRIDAGVPHPYKGV